MTTHIFKGIPILHYSTNIILNQNELDFINNVEWIKKSSNYISKNKYIFNSKELVRIKEMFDYGVNLYMKRILEINHNLRLLNSWITLNKENDYHHTHDHDNVFLSICYYHKIQNGDLIFSSRKSMIQENFNFSYNIISPNPYNANNYSILPQQGDIVIFPAWLFHETSPNKSKSDRIMIGANYFLNGEFGEDT
jgi:uncharacterized protein (TIGR02466 family)